MPPHFIADDADVTNSMVTEGCEIDGIVRDSVLFAGVTVEKGAVVEDSVIMPGTTIKAGAIVRRAIVSENCVIAKRCEVGEADGDIALIGQDTALPEGYVVKAGLQVDTDAISRKEGA
jgi:glucose-1-phosphate adenylyltransferase